MLNFKSLAGITLLALAASSAHAATNHLSCSNSSNVPDETLSALDFDIEVAFSNTGSGGSVGKATTSVSVVFPADSQYAAIAKMALNGQHSSTCILTSAPNSSTTIEVNMKDVVFTGLKLVRGANYNVLADTGSKVELTLAYTSYTLTVN
jgi:hypothetical protein